MHSPVLVNNGIGIVCCLSYAFYSVAPNHWLLITAYFLVWWAGAMAAHSYVSGGQSVAAMAATFGWLVGLCAVALVVVGVVGYTQIGVYPALQLRHFVVAAIMLAIVFGPAGRFVATRLHPIGRLATFLASISYGLYVFHYPLLIHWHRAKTPLGFAIAVLILVTMAYCADNLLGNFLRRPALRPKAPAK